MAIHLDADLLAFTVTTFTVIFGSKSSLQKNTRPIPTRYDLEEIPDSQLTEAQRKYLQPIDEQLARMNYRPDCTFRAKNYGSNLMRRYSNPADAASCGLTVVEVKVQAGQTQSVRNANSVEFTTRLADGRVVSTRNSPNKSLMDNPPYKIVQDFPNLTDLRALKKEHDVLAGKSSGGTCTPPYGAAAIFDEVQREHTRFSEYQVEHGVLRRTPTGDAYQITEKVMNRGIRNFFNPFSKRFSVTQAVFSLLVGAVLPLFAILKIAPLVATSSYEHTLPFAGTTLAIALCYALTGAILGFACNAQSFVWIMLITYVPAHLMAGNSLGWFPYSTLAFYVAYSVSQAKRRRELVLQS
jgi:hypothetical protein